jgi:hypothetical protein
MLQFYRIAFSGLNLPEFSARQLISSGRSEPGQHVPHQNCSKGCFSFQVLRILPNYVFFPRFKRRKRKE